MIVSVGMNKRYFIALFTIFWGSLWAQEELMVYYPSTVKPLLMQTGMTAELRGFKVTVFGRLRDFKKSVSTGEPDWLICPPQLLPQIEGFQTVLEGVKERQRRIDRCWMAL